MYANSHDAYKLNKLVKVVHEVFHHILTTYVFNSNILFIYCDE